MKNILFALVLISVLLSACSSYQKPQFKELSSVKINVKNKFTKTSGTLIFLNPNDEPMTLNELYFDAFFNGNDVGSYTKKTSLVVAAHETISLPFYLEINNEEFDAKSETIELTLKGYINGKIKDDNVSLSFNESKPVIANGKINIADDSEKSKEELRQEKKEQKILEKEQKKQEEIKRKALKEKQV